MANVWEVWWLAPESIHGIWENLDILCVTETWLHPGIDSGFLIIPGYRIIRRDRPARDGRQRRGGGVCVIHREHLRVETLTVQSSNSSIEILWATLIAKASLIVGVIYRPPGGAISPVLEDLHDQLVRVVGMGKPICVVGDTNLDTLQQHKPDVKRYLQILHDLSLRQIVTGPTRPESGSQLDHVIVRSSDDTTAARVVPCAWSDHDLVVTAVPIERTRQRVKTVSVRSTRSLVPDSLCLDLLLTDWSEVHGAADIDTKWEAWLAAWSPNIDRHMPTKQVRLRHPPCPWLTDNPQLRALMRDRDLARADCDDSPGPEAREVYRAKRNAVRGAQCRARASFFLSSFKYSRKTTWKDIRRFLVSPKSAESGPAECRPEWADKLNLHFASVGGRVAAEMSAKSGAVRPIPSCPPRVVSGAFRVHPVTLPELSN